MSAQMKRPAAASAEPKAKRQQEDPHVAKCNAVIALLRTATAYPEAVIQMLEAGARSCLMVPKESRSAVQASMLEMIGEALASVEAGRVAGAEALRQKIAEADTEQKRRATSLEEAAAKKTDMVEAVKKADEALEEARSASAAANAALKTATSEQKVGDADLLKAGDRKASAEQAVSEALIGLKDGTAVDVGQALKMIVKVGKELGFEAQLLQMAEPAFRKPPAERGNFDSMVAQQIADQFSQAIARLTNQLASGESAKAERAAKVEECTAAVHASAEQSVTCQEKLQAAKAGLQDAEVARKAAKKSVDDFGWEMKEAEANVEAAEKTLAACKADLLTFTELVEGPADTPETPPMEAEEATVPAADVEAAASDATGEGAAAAVEA